MKQYKQYMDGVSVSSELHEKLKEAAVAEAQRQCGTMIRFGLRHRRFVKSVVVAVCVCILLAAGVFAAGTLAGFISIDRYDMGNIGGVAYSGYRLNGGLVPISSDALSEELSLQGLGTIQKSFSSIKEAEQYIGIDLKKNPVLEQMAVSDAEYSGWKTPVHCMVSSLSGHQGVKSVSVAAHYQGRGADTAYLPDDIMVNFYARIITEHGVSKAAFDVLYPSANELLIERYQATGGLEAVLIQVAGEEPAKSITIDGVDYELRWYSAYFALDGVAYCLSAVGYEQTGAGAAQPVLEFLKDVLDSYSLESA